MTADQQVKEIIRILSPEDADTQTDAVFIVQMYLDRFRTKIAALEKQLALTEARLEERSKEKHDIVNEKLASEAKLRKERDDIAKMKDIERKDPGPGPGRGRTL